MSKETPKIIGNKSDGYTYKYTSLADIVLAGYELPKMRVAVLVDASGTPVIVGDAPVEYIEAFINDGDSNVKEWVRGARIVVPKNVQKMNEAQAYGSALTYARRYTALTLLGIACEDDKKLEIKTKDEAQAQELAGMKEELAELYKKAGGKAFESWLKERGGLEYSTFGKLKAELCKQITDKAEGKEKAE